jgi:hypothetical protein
MKRVMVGSAVMVAGIALAGCGSQTVSTTAAPPSAPSPTASGNGIVAYDQIDVATWHDDMIAAGAKHDIDMQAVYTLTSKLCGESGHKLALALATTISNPPSERVAFKYVCPSRLKAFDAANQVAD